MAPRPRRAGRLFCSTVIVASSVLLVATAASLGDSPRTGPSSPVLGSKTFAGSAGVGWGTYKPREIFNGGDPSGLIQAISWQNWGAPITYGYGESSIFRSAGGY